MIQTELFLELLMCLFTYPSCLDGARELFDWDVGRQVGKIVFPFAIGSMLADQPGFLAGHMLRSHAADALGHSVGDPDADGCKTGREPTLRASPPTDLTPSGVFQHLVRGNGFAVRYMAQARSPAARH